MPKTNKAGRSEPCGKQTCLVCNSINAITIFKTEDFGETFTIQTGPLNFDSEILLYLLKYSVFGEVSYVGKAKTKFQYVFGNYKSKNTELSEKEIKKLPGNFYNHYCVDGHA